MLIFENIDLQNGAGGLSFEHVQEINVSGIKTINIIAYFILII